MFGKITVVISVSILNVFADPRFNSYKISNKRRNVALEYSRISTDYIFRNHFSFVILVYD